MVVNRVGKEGEPISGRKFNITPKTPHEYFASAHFDPQGFDARVRVTHDMVENAKELLPNADWEFALRSGVVRPNRFVKSGHEEGVRALTNFPFILRTGRLVRELGLDMHSPEVVWASASFILHKVEERRSMLEQKVAQIEEGRTMFETEEQKQKMLAEGKEAAYKLGVFRDQLEPSLNEYIALHFSGNRTYFKVIQTLFHFHENDRAGYSTKAKAIELMRAGQIDKAYTLLYPQGRRE